MNVCSTNIDMSQSERSGNRSIEVVMHKTRSKSKTLEGGGTQLHLLCDKVLVDKQILNFRHLQSTDLSTEDFAWKGTFQCRNINDMSILLVGMDGDGRMKNATATLKKHYQKGDGHSGFDELDIVVRMLDILLKQQTQHNHKLMTLTGSTGNGKTAKYLRKLKESMTGFLPEKQQTIIPYTIERPNMSMGIHVNVIVLQGKNKWELQSMVEKYKMTLSTRSCDKVSIVDTNKDGDKSDDGNKADSCVKDVANIHKADAQPSPAVNVSNGKVISDDNINDLLQTDKYQRNAAHRAAVDGNLDTLKHLLETVGIPARDTSSNRLTLLHLAAMFRHEPIVEYLCEAYPSLVNETDAIERNALHIAAQKNNLRIVKTLIHHGVDVYAPAGEGSTVLHIAASHENTDMVEYICDNFFFNHLNIPNKLGLYPIHYAARLSIGNIEILLNKGELPDKQTSTGSSILHIAAHHGKLEILRYISDNHEEVLKLMDKVGLSSAHTAARQGHLACLEYLLETNNVPRVSKQGWTVIDIAARSGKLDIVRFLCENYRSLVNHGDGEHWTAAHHAAFGGHISCLEYLCGNGVVDPYATVKTGMTMLHIAARFRDDDTVQWICDTFGDMVNMKDGKGNTALHYARESGSHKAIDALSKHC